MLSSVALRPFNRILLHESWASKRLQLHAGKTVRFSILPFLNINLTVQDNGELSSAMSDVTIDTNITIILDLLPRMLAHDEEAYSKIKISGDKVFAEEFLFISKNLHWDVEQDLSRIMGDILAHRVVKTSADLKQWHNKAILNLSEALAEYWTEEKPLLAKSTYIHEFISEVSILREDVEQLEKRVEKISRLEF
jgi:ubiquinone biosynthesis protein UbiJ